MSVAELVGTRTNDTYRLSCCLLHCSSLITFRGLGCKGKRKIFIREKIQKEESVSEGNKASQLCPLLMQQENEARGSACQNRLQLDPKHYRWVTEVYLY